MKLNVTSIKLQKKQTTTKVKVTGLANGDSVKSWTSSNKKIVTVDKNGKIKGWQENWKRKDHHHFKEWQESNPEGEGTKREGKNN